MTTVPRREHDPKRKISDTEKLRSGLEALLRSKGMKGADATFGREPVPTKEK